MMKNINIILLLFILFMPLYCINAQEYTDTTKTIVNNGETIKLNLVWTTINHGNIQWQSSVDGKSWNDVAGATTKTSQVTVSQSLLYRAKVVSGTCNPFYSKITKVTVIDLNINNIYEVTETSAKVTSSLASASDKNIVEKGLALDVKGEPTVLSTLISSGKDDGNFITNLDNLISGAKYYIRPYAKLADGSFVFGATQSFSTINITALNRANLTANSAQIWYSASSYTPIQEHGVFYSSVTNPDTFSTKVTGKQIDGLFAATITGLNAASVYNVLPYVRISGKYYCGAIQQVKTYSDYSSFAVTQDTIKVAHKIEWNSPVTARKISLDGIYADYGRVKRIGLSDTLLLVYHGGPNSGDWINIYLRRSFDNGVTWQEQQTVGDLAKTGADYWRYCNPELLVLKNGTVLLAYEANSKGDENNSSVQIISSSDSGKTWSNPFIYKTGRSWEPSMVELPNGEVELFYSCEQKWWPSVSGSSVYQEIDQIHSTDYGKSWSHPQMVAYYPYKRDGMAVPVLLQGNAGVTFTIECVNSGTSPYIIKKELASPWILTTSNFEKNTYRWLANGFSGHGGAPYIIQLPTGETVLSAHIYRGGDWHTNYAQVMVGNNFAQKFADVTTPFGVTPNGQGVVDNSLFVKDASTIALITAKTLYNGGTPVKSEIYWLEGAIKLK